MTTAVETRLVRTQDRRELCVELVGDGPEGTVLLCAGTPNSRRLYRGWVDDALSRGLRLVGYDRPGYGRSTPVPGHTVADAAADVRSIAEDLGVERLAVWGFSGGGPYSLACAALLPDLVAGAGVVCSLAPWDAPGLDFFTGMGEDNERDIKLFFSDREAAREKSRRDWEEELRVTPEGIIEAWKTLLSPVDAQALRGDFAQAIVDAIHDGLAGGDQGWWDDAVAHLGPWGFELDSIRVPVKIWHGRQDHFVPFQHGQWLAEQVPGAEAALSDNDGHLSLLIDKVGDVHRWLIEQLRLRSEANPAPRA